MDFCEFSENIIVIFCVFKIYVKIFIQISFRLHLPLKYSLCTYYPRWATSIFCVTFSYNFLTSSFVSPFNSISQIELDYLKCLRCPLTKQSHYRIFHSDPYKNIRKLFLNKCFRSSISERKFISWYQLVQSKSFS